MCLRLTSFVTLSEILREIREELNLCSAEFLATERYECLKRPMSGNIENPTIYGHASERKKHYMYE